MHEIYNYCSFYYLNYLIIFNPKKFTFFFIWEAVSVKKMAELGSLELIFVFAPWRAGKNVEWSNDGLG